MNLCRSEQLNKFIKMTTIASTLSDQNIGISMKFSKSILASSILLMATSTAALADHSAEHTASNISYDNASVSYKSLSVDGVSEDYKGFKLGLQKKVFESDFYIALEYSKMNMDLETFEIDTTETRAGIGYGYTISPDFAIDAEFGFVESDAEFSGYEFSENGHYFGARAHYMFLDNVEGYAELKRFSYSGADGSFSEFTLGAKYIISEKFDVFAEHISYDGESGLEFGATYRF